MNNKTERIFHAVGLNDLAQIRQYVGETAVNNSYDSVAINELIVAVNEAVANIIRHGYQDTPGTIAVVVICSNDTIQVTLLDNSPGFDPTTVSSPDMTLPLEERPFGGMGVHMMREFCDEVTYRRTENNENELTLLKRVD